MTRKILAIGTCIVLLLVGCKKKDNGIDSRLTDHYMFQTGTYWVYLSSVGRDSQTVTSTGIKDGMPYMQIEEDLNGHHRATIYIGVGPTGSQLQLWGYDILLNSSPQTIFDVNIPTVGTTVAQGLIYAGRNNGGVNPPGIMDDPYHYTVDYDHSNKNQEYGYVDYYFWPDYGILQKDEYNTPSGDIYWSMSRCHIVK